MKNFSELTAIKPTLMLDISLLLVAVEQCDYTIIINGETVSTELLTSSTEFKKQIELTESIDISISVKNRQHPQAIIIKGLYIDGYEVMPTYQHLAMPPTNYIDFTGVWRLEIPNFYPWYHEITGQGWTA
jgi:hypothetical protein